MSFTQQAFTVGPLDVNCYILKDQATGAGVVIDAGGNAAVLQEYLEAEQIHLVYLLNTHGHGDHIGACDALRDVTGAPLYIHPADAGMLTDARANLSAFMGFSITARPADGFLQDGQVLSFGESHLQVLATPGHSPGGVCFLSESALFSGDSLFAGSIGRCDFPGGSTVQLVDALHEKILPLADALQIFPGHGPATSLGQERLNNVYLQVE